MEFSLKLISSVDKLINLMKFYKRLKTPTLVNWLLHTSKDNYVIVGSYSKY